MMQETEGALGKNFEVLPLKNYATIVKENALRIDWRTLCKPENLSFIIGNPPYVGYSNQTAAQKMDIRTVYFENPKSGKLDYVVAWYRKTAEFIRKTSIRCAFVSTNSIVQGEQCADTWKLLYENFDIHIDFAHRSFKWTSDSENVAQVHCVVIGFSSAPNLKQRKIFDGNKIIIAKNINFYLSDGENIFVRAHTKPLQKFVSRIITGNRPADGGNLILSEEEKNNLLKNYPGAKKFIRLLLGAEEFINSKKRFCLWLKNFSIEEIKKFPPICERIEKCRQDRLRGAVDRQKLSSTPHLFRETKNPKCCIIIPEVSSGNRRYIPMGFINDSVICTDSLKLVMDATIYDFGILTSSIHMAWMRAIDGCFGIGYHYTKNIVYNNFPWCEVTERQRRMIERSARNILETRESFPDWTFARLYDEKTMPDELRAAHKNNDYVVALAYGFSGFWEDESRVVTELMKRYKELVSDN